jgi:hypothetical protein
MQVKADGVEIKISQEWVLPDGPACKQVTYRNDEVAGVRNHLEQMSTNAT